MTTLQLESMLFEIILWTAISLVFVCLVIGIMYMRLFRKKRIDKKKAARLNHLLAM